MKINQNFLGEGGMQNKKFSVGGLWIFSGTAHYSYLKLNSVNLFSWSIRTRNLYYHSKGMGEAITICSVLGYDLQSRHYAK